MARSISFPCACALIACLQGNLAAQAPPEQQGAAAPGAPADAPAGAGSGSYSANLYSHDDGTTESSIGLILGGTLCWFQRFDTVGAYDLITHVEVAFGFPQNPGFGIPNGTPVTACIWEDPNEDGDPTDAQLLTMAASTVQNNDTQFLNVIPISPTTVRGRFFVGVFLKHNQNQFPASRDMHTLSLGRAFFLGTITFNGVFDPAHLAGPGHTQIFSLDTAGTPPGSLNSVWRVRAQGEAPAVTTYCVPKINSLGCVPSIAGVGVPQASAFAGFVVADNNVRNQKTGLLLYGTTGPIAIPFQGGVLCVNAPVKRSVPRSSGGTSLPGSDCTGRYELDMNAFAHGLYGGSPLPLLLTAGTQVNCQWWGRDPGFPPPNNSALSNGLQYPVLP